MRRLIVMVLAGVLLAPLPLHAQQVSPEKLQALARHSQNLSAIYAQGLEISTQMDDAEALIDSYAAGDMSETEMRAEIAAVRIRAQNAIGDYEAALDALPPRPLIGDGRRDEGLAAFDDMVRGLAGHLRAQQKLLQRLADTAASGDARAYDLAGADSLALAGALIEAENTAVEAALVGADASHPQRGLYHASIGSNLAMQAALILLEDSLRGGHTRAADARAGIERGLARASRGIESGRRDADAMLARLAGSAPASEADRLGKRFIADLVTAYHRAFDDETRIVDAMRSFLDDLIVALEAPESEAGLRLAAAAQTFEGEIVALMDARFAEQSRRLTLVEEFSAALATAQ